ncbi:MAG: helix-turn-helix domain-containing protein [Chloroflexota bacterium]|nr:helix-turn-helix domain-containing protein [Chloroflexota bacterium]
MGEQQGYTIGSGNVFADLGLAEPEEALTKAALVHGIAEIVAARGWTQGQSAEAPGIDQPKVSALFRGRLTGFSIARLLRFLTALDQDVAIVVGPTRLTRPRRGHGSTSHRRRRHVIAPRWR